MDLMNLVAKMTLDATAYETKLTELVKNPPSMPDVTVVPIWDEKQLESLGEQINRYFSDKNGGNPVDVTPKIDAKEYKQSLEDVEHETNWFKEVMVGVWQGLKDALVAVGVTGVITGVINYMRQGISLATKNGDAIEKGAKNLQISTRAYQEYEYALGKSNIQMSEMRQVMSQIDKIRAGDKSFTDYLNKIGVDSEKAKSGLMSAEEMLNGIMRGLADYKGNDKGVIIDAFFGKGTKWTGYFDQTSAEIEGLKDEAESIGYIMSDEGIKNAKEYQDATEKLGQRLEAIQRSFGEGILPLITDAVNKLMMIVDFFTGQDKRSSSEKFTDLNEKFEAQISDIRSTGIYAKTLAQQLFSMGDTSTMDARDLAIWKGVAQSLVDTIPTLSGVIDVENGTISESVDGISELIDKYTELSEATAYQTSKAERQAIIDQKEKELIEKSTKANNDLAKAEGNRTEAIDAFNAVIEKYGKFYGGVDGIGYDATLEDVEAAKTRLMNAMFGDEQNMGLASAELSTAISPLTSLLGQAANAQTDIENLSADIEQGTADFENWVATQGELYEGIGGTAETAAGLVNDVAEALNGIPNDIYSTIHISTDGEKPEGFAKGSWNVPYDMPAYLHRDEMVLTKSQARKYRDGEGGGVDYAYVGTLIGNSVKDAMSSIFVALDGNKVGDFTTRRTEKNIRRRETSKIRGKGG